MGTNPPIWTPTGISGESITAWSTSTAPLAAIKESVVLVEGMPSGNPNNNHGSPDAITGLGNGYYGGQLKMSVDQFVASKRRPRGSTGPSPRCCWGRTPTPAAPRVFYGGRHGGNLPTIGSPLSAFTTVFGGDCPRDVGLVAAQPAKEHPGPHPGRGDHPQELAGRHRAGEAGLHLESVRQLENKLMQSANTTPPATCMKPAAPAGDGALMHMSELDTLAANAIHQNLIVSAFACDITRWRACSTATTAS